jgi:hypothetical protein
MNGNITQTTRGILHSVCVTILGMAFTVALPLAAHADNDKIRVPAVPAGVEVDPPNDVVFVGHAIGTQNYVCLPSGSTFAWSLFTPEATLFNDKGKQLTTHFFSINPFEPVNIIRATWEDSRDTSTVWGKVIKSSSDAPFVNPGAIAWLKVQVSGAQDGPTGDRLSETTFIQRLNTVGGLAPATGCAVATDVGSRAFMPYTADYFFYEDASRHHRYDR